MKEFLLFVLLVIILAITTSKGQSTNTTSCSDDVTENALVRLRRRLLSLSAAYLNEQIEKNPEKKCNFSPPYSLFGTALLANFAFGNTRRQTLRALDQQNQNTVSCPFQRIKEYGLATSGLSLSANIYGNIKLKFTKSTQKTLKNITGGQSLNIDFKNYTKAATCINKVIKKDTRNEIPGVLSTADKLSPNSELVLVTALKLKTIFMHKINMNNITNYPFYVKPNMSTRIPYFYVNAVFNFTISENLNATVVKVPCQDSIYGLLIMPNVGEKIKNVVNKLKQKDFYDILTEELKPTLLQMTLPYFKNISSSINIKKLLEKNLQLSTIFNSKQTQLNGFVSGNKNISISYGIQKCVYEGNILEKGASEEVPKNMKNIVVSYNRPYIFIFVINDIPFVSGYTTFALSKA